MTETTGTQNTVSKVYLVPWFEVAVGPLDLRLGVFLVVSKRRVFASAQVLGRRKAGPDVQTGLHGTSLSLSPPPGGEGGEACTERH